jgi:uncharacterized phage infection (PIP) family protein YhgE
MIRIKQEEQERSPTLSPIGNGAEKRTRRKRKTPTPVEQDQQQQQQQEVDAAEAAQLKREQQAGRQRIKRIKKHVVDQLKERSVSLASADQRVDQLFAKLAQRRAQLEKLIASVQATIDRNKQQQQGAEEDEDVVIAMRSKRFAQFARSMGDVVACMDSVSQLALHLSAEIADARRDADNLLADVSEFMTYMFEGMQTQFRYTPDPNRHNMLVDLASLQL